MLLHDGGGDRSAHRRRRCRKLLTACARRDSRLFLASDLIGQTRAQVMPPLTFRERLVAHADGLIFTLYEWSRLGIAWIFVLGIALVSGRALIVGRARAHRKAAPGAARSARISSRW